MALTNLERLIVERSVDDIYAAKPESITGYIDREEALFLSALILEQSPSTVAEIGTAAGVSSAVIAGAVQLLAQANGRAPAFRSFDLMERCYFDKTKPTGFFVAECTPELVEWVAFSRGVTVAELGRYFQPGGLDFLFIDANHKHPWPSLDLLVALPYLADDATVCLHDVNLPLVNPNFPSWGVKHLFDAVTVDKRYSAGVRGRIPNMGAFRLHDKKRMVRHQVTELVRTIPWEHTVDSDWLNRVGLGDLEEIRATNVERLKNESADKNAKQPSAQ